MKGIALEYIFIVVIIAAAIVISISFITGFIKPEFVPKIQFVSDVRYACAQYNGTRISFDDFKTVLYGFITGQCNNFSAELGQGITIDDIKRVAEESEKGIQVVQLSSCHFLETNTHTIYTCCSDLFESGKNINITRREIKNSDVLICGQ